jgi:uncharacterized membrane protein
MMYALLKLAHIVSVTLFFGAGIASVVLKLRADRAGDVRDIAFALRHVVVADWLFTIPSGVLLPLTGAGMVMVAGYPWSTPWIMYGFALYVVAGLCWLPAWRLQFRMRDAAEAAVRGNTPLPPEYHRWTRIWAALGVPSFFASVGAMWMMVGKGM